ncbi:Uncharacterised protein [Mycobacteroides abscessus subsp. massiliense]|nr:Uncharacterised protein [Mycobacteroides abscessus subsp. massiliense]SKH91788.1 Uncharacterised protein [Mycobacteroides abscessus subsp. massiliense]SKI12445.1 Uncharacterised protein [Mycobacteroides abscessus subsp. massiliense]SKK22693.1 Uncharacterised protein [Mycobacteroides abscessus subsp. massiliense]SKK30537.1 Uncharacterised protein [Mycobacteroides abscessus subsp. massiliense]
MITALITACLAWLVMLLSIRLLVRRPVLVARLIGTYLAASAITNPAALLLWSPEIRWCSTVSVLFCTFCMRPRRRDLLNSPEGLA